MLLHDQTGSEVQPFLAIFCPEYLWILFLQLVFKSTQSVYLLNALMLDIQMFYHQAAYMSFDTLKDFSVVLQI